MFPRNYRYMLLCNLNISSLPWSETITRMKYSDFFLVLLTASGYLYFNFNLWILLLKCLNFCPLFHYLTVVIHFQLTMFLKKRTRNIPLKHCCNPEIRFTPFSYRHPLSFSLGLSSLWDIPICFPSAQEISSTKAFFELQPKT